MATIVVVASGFSTVPVDVFSLPATAGRCAVGHSCWRGKKPVPCPEAAPTRCALPSGGGSAVVVGGIGDSGTRALQMALDGPLGVDMCRSAKGGFIERSRDAYVFRKNVRYEPLLKGAAAAAAAESPLDYDARAAARWGLEDAWNHTMFQTCFAVNVTLECLSQWC